jgi:CAAX amino terminal protease family.
MLWALIVLYFDKKVKPFYHPDQGKDMLMIALVFEILRFVITEAKKFLGYESLLSNGLIPLIFLILVFAITKYAFPIKLKDIGLKKFSQWNRYEVVYLLFIVPLGFFGFWYFTRDKFNDSLHEIGAVIMMITFIFYLAWGFYQEWIYRGFVQTEFTRRYGATKAIILANLLFTFGPLHFTQLYHRDYITIAATFLIGLIFGILYHRSYNLWIVGILHGIGAWFLAGLP